MATCVDLIVPVTGSAGAVGESVNGVSTPVPYIIGRHAGVDYSTCGSSSLVLLTPAELADLQAQPAADAAQIAAINALFGPVLAVLALVWGYKQIKRQLNASRVES